MEHVLGVYKRLYSNKMKDGTKPIDFEFSRKGVCNLFVANEPLSSKQADCENYRSKDKKN